MTGSRKDTEPPEPPSPVSPTGSPGHVSDEAAAGRPIVPKPDGGGLLARMKRVDPDIARRYRQQPGQ